jgi:excisionase family DNA binding protein
MGEPERLYTRKEACVRLHCNMLTLEKLIRQSELPVIWMGRKILLRESTLQHWIEAHEQTQKKSDDGTLQTAQ